MKIFVFFLCAAASGIGAFSSSAGDSPKTIRADVRYLKAPPGVLPDGAIRMEARKWDGSKRVFRLKKWSKSVDRMESPPVVTIREAFDTDIRKNVDLSALRNAESASYEFVVEAAQENNLSPILLADREWGLKFDQASLMDLRTNQFGFTRFSDRDHFFEPVNNASVASPYARTSHIVFTVEKERTQVFLDGELIGVSDGPGHVYSAPDADLGFSDAFPDSSTKLDGVIHAFAAYDRALEAQEVYSQACAAMGAFVTLLGPKDGVKAVAGRSMEFVATAGSRTKAEVTVEFLVDGRKEGEASKPPYRFSWATVPHGRHEVRAVAMVNGKRVAESGSVAVVGVAPEFLSAGRMRKNTGKALTAAEAGAFVLRGSNNLRDWHTLTVLRGIESMEKLADTVKNASTEYRFYQLFPDE